MTDEEILIGCSVLGSIFVAVWLAFYKGFKKTPIFEKIESGSQKTDKKMKFSGSQKTDKKMKFYEIIISLGFSILVPALMGYQYAKGANIWSDDSRVFAGIGTFLVVFCGLRFLSKKE